MVIIVPMRKLNSFLCQIFKQTPLLCVNFSDRNVAMTEPQTSTCVTQFQCKMSMSRLTFANKNTAITHRQPRVLQVDIRHIMYEEGEISNITQLFQCVPSMVAQKRV
jgi:hypothetical protein